MKGEQTLSFSQMEAPARLLWQALPLQTNFSGHLIIHLKKLMTDSLNTPGAQPELPSLLPSFSSLFGRGLHYLVSTSPPLQTRVSILASLPPSGNYGKLPVGVWLTTALANLLQPTEKMLTREKTCITKGNFNFYFKHNRRSHKKITRYLSFMT